MPFRVDPHPPFAQPFAQPFDVRLRSTLPWSSEQMTALTGITPGGMYLCRETSGALADVLGGTSLAAGGSPVYQQHAGDRLGVRYPAASQNSADVAALGTSSGWYAAIFTISDATLGLPGIVGRCNAAFNRCAAIYSQTAGAGWTIQVRDGVAGPASITGTTNVGAGSWLAQLQIDRSASLARGRMSRVGGGVAEQIQVSIAGFGTLGGASLLYGFGGLAGIFTGGATVGWGAWATGVQCEGASFLATTAQRMGVE